METQPEFVEPWSPEMSDGCSILPFLPPALRRQFSEWAIPQVAENPHLAELACKMHDREYYYGGPPELRKTADRDLRRNWINAGVPRFKVEMGYRLIRLFGGPSWKREGVSWAFGGSRFRYSEEPARPQYARLEKAT